MLRIKMIKKVNDKEYIVDGQIYYADSKSPYFNLGRFVVLNHPMCEYNYHMQSKNYDIFDDCINPPELNWIVSPEYMTVWRCK